MTPPPNDLRGDGRRTDVVWSRINDASTCTDDARRRLRRHTARSASVAQPAHSASVEATPPALTVASIGIEVIATTNERSCAGRSTTLGLRKWHRA